MAEQWIIFGHLDGNVKLYGRKLIIYGSNKKKILDDICMAYG